MHFPMRFGALFFLLLAFFAFVLLCWRGCDSQVSDRFSPGNATEASGPSPAGAEVVERLRPEQAPHARQAADVPENEENEAVFDLPMETEEAPCIGCSFTTGHILDSAGRPVSPREVALWGYVVQGDGRSGTRVWFTNDGNFQYRACSVEDGPIDSLDFEATNGFDAIHVQGIVPGTRGVEIRFPRKGKVRLRVSDSDSGHPIPSFRCWLQKSSIPNWMSLVAVPDAVTGTIEVLISEEVSTLLIDARERGYRLCTIPSVTVDPDGAAQPIMVALSKGVTVQTKLVFADGESAWQCKIALVPEDGSIGLEGLFALDGSIELRGLTPGRYRIQIYNPNSLTPIAWEFLSPQEIFLPDGDEFSFSILGKKAGS